MPIGRNDPCPCGSGKKFKKCCLHKESQKQHERWQEAAAEQAEKLAGEQDWQPALVDAPGLGDTDFDSNYECDSEDETIDALPAKSEGRRQPDPHRKVVDEWWEQFEQADLDTRIEQFIRMLDQPAWLGDELAYEMLDAIRAELLKRDERARFGILVGALRERLPEVCTRQAAYFVSWLIEDALAEGHLDAVAALGQEMAATAGKNVDMFCHVVDQLAYHGQLATLVEMMRIAWPLVIGSGEILPWGVEEIRSKAIWYEVLQYCEHASPPQPDNPEIKQGLESYTDSLRPEWLPELVELLTGTGGDASPLREANVPETDLSEAEEDPAKLRERRKRERDQQWYRLSLEFLRYLFREEGVPYAKGELARVKIFDYLEKRRDGDLWSDDDFFGAAPRHRRKSKPQPLPEHGALCPDRDSLDRYLASRSGTFGEGQYEVAAVMELMPAWLRFLRRRELIDAERQTAALKNLAGLNAVLLPHWKRRKDDPALYQGALRAWQKPHELPAGAAAACGTRRSQVSLHKW